MSIDVIGHLNINNSSESQPAKGADFDISHLEAAAKALDEAGFDRALIHFTSVWSESMMVAQHAASVTKRLAFMVAHRPGFTAPTIAARQFATLDQLTGGRAAVHIITGGNDAELRQDGSHIGKDERYARADEYLDIMKKEWTSDKPFDYRGNYYHVEQAFSKIKCINTPHIPVYFGGASDAAIEVAGKHADVYALWGETYAQARETVARVKAAAAKHGRQIRFSLSMRPILAATEESAWKKAQDILEQTKQLSEKTGPVFKPQENTGAHRLLEAAAQGPRVDKRLWTELAKLTGAWQGNSTSLVGTAEQVVDAMLDYYDMGITTFLIRGFDPIEDTKLYGRELLPLLREMTQKRSAGEPPRSEKSQAGSRF
ncbi:LLM class flavin-dependent oxidoreductase [Mesorhizobium sp. CA8]|uniref:LLM class flavin-dependent oxidoreductase n=1 Tax=unclassified Mesorhizobium TaxID=325217 RepID=UPI001CCE0476|nr:MULTISPECIES: LLM class flavin-dependent oxidoreductase [unclassified Mesorhizobium]MBZ9764969.1 LLM class flavin-dependent oxidoreductase [Mesorhizobium sp. CA8]MBZ9823617.1 LLM class flavin-dependent oxidoreductase [Mesorhizobium sp. CA4]